MTVPRPPDTPHSDLACEAIAIRELNATVIDATDIGTHAIEYAINGWEVLPLRGKAPAIPKRLGGNGVLDATTDINKVIGWWGGGYRGCNIGIRVPESMFVLDVDGPDRWPHPGKGLEALAQVEAEYGPLPATMGQITGSGGLHLFFRRPRGCKLSKTGLPAGLEYKDRGGFVVAAPSVHPDSGEQYVRFNTDIIAEAPEWLLAMIVDRPKPVQPIRPSRRSTFWNSLGSSPAERFNASTSWADILMPHGWEFIYDNVIDPDADGAKWLHPTATSKCSATIKYGCLFVYSPNTPFQVTEAGNRHGYTKFRAHAVLNHGGDTKAAARAFIKDQM
jgi:Bifunctional DNA primase/polymerase, N-terminal